MVAYEKCDRPVSVASSLDDEVDLNAGPKRQRSHPDRRAGGKRLAEMLRVDPIHRDEVADVREIHAGARDIIETLAGRLEDRCEIPKHTLGLGDDAPLDHLARGRVLADLTTEVEETADFDRLGERADRWREFGRGNGLAHGELLLGTGCKRTSLPTALTFPLDRHFRQCIILTMMLPLAHDAAMDWKQVLGAASGGSRARRLTSARRVCPGRVHCGRS